MYYSQIPSKLVSVLLNLELKSQGANRHSKIFTKIRSELSKEWSDVDNDAEFKEIMIKQHKRKNIKDKADPIQEKDKPKFRRKTTLNEKQGE